MYPPRRPAPSPGKLLNASTSSLSLPYGDGKTPAFTSGAARQWFAAPKPVKKTPWKRDGRANLTQGDVGPGARNPPVARPRRAAIASTDPNGGVDDLDPAPCGHRPVRDLAHRLHGVRD